MNELVAYKERDVATAGFLGWVVAHNTIATECKTLGGFYVGKTVYECNVKGETK